mmetsp:Transcript_11559/g.32452  ORF Transcript_11559/g.32452 Transcript_11559/m.32452 type:complete len:442 (+) Transcript_11559:283-1608(+)
MGCIASTAACGACCCCSAAGDACGKCMDPGQLAKIIYASVFIVVSLLTLVMSYWASELMSWIPNIGNLETGPCTEDAEGGDGDECESALESSLAVYRMTFALFTYHLMLGLAVVNVKDRGECRAGIHTSWWWAKALLFVVLTVSAFLIPTPFFVVYGWLALVGAGAFIILQMLMLVDFAHTLNESWVSKYEVSEDRKYIAYLAGSTLTCFACAVTLVVLMFALQLGPATWVSPFLVTLNVILCLAITALSIHPRIQKAERTTPVGLLQASFVSFYASYLVFGALLDNTDAGGGALETTTILIGSFFVILCVGYTAIRISGHEETYFGHENEESINFLHEDTLDIERGGGDSSVGGGEDEPSGPVAYNYAFFHGVFALGALYLAMLMTSWATVSGSDAGAENTLSVDQGQAAMWVKICTSWVILGLYLWTVVAPVLLPNRQW